MTVTGYTKTDVPRLFDQRESAMPTLRRIEGYRFYFYSHEPNEPTHVHIDKAGASAKVWLVPVSLARNRGFREKELGVILGLVREHRKEFLEAWHEYFGKSR
jgi:hypothetical protein